MTEPDVTLTDYGLAVECALFACLLERPGARRGPLRAWFVLFFGSAGLAALAGGTVHGFFLDPATAGARVLWPLTLLASGATALAAWAIGARIQFAEAAARRIEIAAALEFSAYAAIVVLGDQAFAVAVLNYLPAALFLLVVFGLAYRRTGERPILIGTLGLGATFVASAVQQAGVSLHPVYVNHNALYHLIEAGALFLLFQGARHFVGAMARE
ncbi:MAG: hypothetical protein HY002_03175 [Candidatus Rokubacteria bacterium]|nr:hypothetical protein [Candidatus Rokubacteria bacterium]